MKIRLAGIIENSLNNGIGIRKVIFAQGCKHNCPGCFNPHTHDMYGGKLFDIQEIADICNDDYFIDGVTFSGGDPFEQPEAFSELAKLINVNIWCFTGYTYEQLLNLPEKRCLLKEIDVLVDGRFDINKIGGEHKYRGSNNQRIIDVKESLKLNKVVELYL